MMRAGIRSFWADTDRTVPRGLVTEMAPVAVLLMLCVMQTVKAGPVMRFMQATAQSLHAPKDYIRGVQGTPEQQAYRAGGS
jgi:multicomponent K+:H+ antiporter subunit D